MLLNIAVIGIGNCGSQIAKLANTQENIPALAINISQTDLQTVEGIDRLLIGDGSGSGQDIRKSKAEFRTFAENLLGDPKLTKLVTTADVVFVAHSTGGGSGAGMGPIFANVIKHHYGKPTISIAVLPRYNEGYGRQVNSIEVFKDLVQNSELTYMTYDNQKYSHFPSNTILDEVNKDIVDDLRIIRGDYLPLTKYDSIDKADLLRLISVGGRLATLKVFDLKEQDLDNQTIDELLISGIKKTATAEIDRTRDFKSLGIISNLDENIKSKFNHDLPQFKESYGEPIETFYHDYIIPQDKLEEVNNKVCLIMSGLSVPNDRLSKMLSIVKEIKGKREKLETRTSVLDNIDTGDYSSIRVNKGLNSHIEDNKENKDVKVSLDDLFNKFNC